MQEKGDLWTRETIDAKEVEEALHADQKDKPVVSTWADDITVITNNRTDACRTIRTQLQVSKRINLPLSAKKAQLLIIYPRNFKGKRRRPGQYLSGIRVLRHVKILGLIFQQPRFTRAKLHGGDAQ